MILKVTIEEIKDKAGRKAREILRGKPIIDSREGKAVWLTEEEAKMMGFLRGG